MFALITAIASGVLLILFLVLLRVEASRGERIALTRFRSFLDRAVIRGANRMLWIQNQLGAGTIRVTFHYLMHKLLSRLVQASKWLGAYLERLQQRNRRLVRAAKNGNEKTHLDLITEHKANNTLSATERKKLKRRSLEGETY